VASERKQQQQPISLTTHGALVKVQQKMDDDAIMTRVLPVGYREARRQQETCLEVLAGVAVQMASHRGGLGGVCLRDFLVGVAQELSMSLLPSLHWSTDTNKDRKRQRQRERH
jgi:hypothetical protein